MAKNAGSASLEPAYLLFFSLRSSCCVMPWRDKLQLGVFGFRQAELALPLRYQAELGNEEKLSKCSKKGEYNGTNHQRTY
jgi:hypothetical protein